VGKKNVWHIFSWLGSYNHLRCGVFRKIVVIYMTDEKISNKNKPKSAPESAPESVPDPVLNPQVGSTTETREQAPDPVLNPQVESTILIKEADPDRATLERARRFLNSLEDK
jgi:hypothetical protein